MTSRRFAIVLILGLAIFLTVPIYNVFVLEPVGKCSDPDGYHMITVAGSVNEMEDSYAFDGNIELGGATLTNHPSATDIEITFLDRYGKEIRTLSIDPISNRTAYSQNISVTLPRQPETISLEADLKDDTVKGWSARYYATNQTRIYDDVLWYRPDGGCLELI